MCLLKVYLTTAWCSWILGASQPPRSSSITKQNPTQEYCERLGEYPSSVQFSRSSYLPISQRDSKAARTTTHITPHPWLRPDSIPSTVKNECDTQSSHQETLPGSAKIRDFAYWYGIAPESVSYRSIDTGIDTSPPRNSFFINNFITARLIKKL